MQMARPIICRKVAYDVPVCYFKPQGLSRQTLGNILARAHKKVATALIDGKALRISIADETIQHPGAVDQPATIPLNDGEKQ